MRPLSNISQLRLHNHIKDLEDLRRLEQINAERQRLEEINNKARQEQQKVTSIKEIERQLELHYKHTGPIDIWV